MNGWHHSAGLLAVWGPRSCIGGALKELIKRQRAQLCRSASSDCVSASSSELMALNTAASPSGAVSASAEVVEAEVPDEVIAQARGHPRPRQSEEGTSAIASTSAPECVFANSFKACHACLVNMLRLYID